MEEAPGVEIALAVRPLAPVNLHPTALAPSGTTTWCCHGAANRTELMVLGWRGGAQLEDDILAWRQAALVVAPAAATVAELAMTGNAPGRSRA